MSFYAPWITSLNLFIICSTICNNSFLWSLDYKFELKIILKYIMQQYSSVCVLQSCSEQRPLHDFKARSHKSTSKDLISCPVSPSLKICIISCHIHIFVSACNLKFQKNSRIAPIEFPKNSQIRTPQPYIPKEFPNQRIPRKFLKNFQRIPKKFPKNSQKIPKKSQKNLTRAYRSKSFSSLLVIGRWMFCSTYSLCISMRYDGAMFLDISYNLSR